MSDREYFRQFNRKIVDLRIPLTGSFELTSRCNFNCIHCYIGPQTLRKKLAGNELNTSQILSIIDEITEAGCLNLLFTGGEPLLRKDFAEIYRHTKRNGVLVTVFSNGTLINDPIVSLLKDLPPQSVEITLYGATEETYEKITGVKGSLKKCLKGIKLLMDSNVNVKLKTILMTVNRHEFFDIENIAKDLGVDFRFDAAISPRLNGDKFPITLRVSAKEAVKKEFSDEGRSRRWKTFFNDFKGIRTSDSLYICGAGLSSFHIDSYANLRPCLMTTGLKYNLLKGSFKKGWSDVMPRLKDKKAGVADTCSRCEKRTLCGYCPGFFGLEKGSEDISSEYLCSIGNDRFQQIQHSK